MEFDRIEPLSLELERANHQLNDNTPLIVPNAILQELAHISYQENRYYFRASHLEHWRHIVEAADSSDSEKQKMWRNLKAAVLAKQNKVSYCQDCGTDSAYIARGGRVLLEPGVETAIETGAVMARRENPFRNSIFVPQPNFNEANSNDNSPTEIHWLHDDDAASTATVRGVFSNKGGGSGSKLWSFSLKPIMAQDRAGLLAFIQEKLVEIGHSACPPYHVSVVLGGISFLHNSALLTLSTLDEHAFSARNRILRDEALEGDITQFIRSGNLGAQGAGAYFVMPDGVRVWRAPRHAAHFFVSIGVSCSAHRVQAFNIDRTGVYLERLEKHPEQYIPAEPKIQKQLPRIDTRGARAEVLKALRALNAGDEFLIDGFILGARDKAHFRWQQQGEGVSSGQDAVIPDYLKEHVAVCYVGPTDTPEGAVIGSFGPTTAGRMDAFAPFLLSRDFVPLSLGKGTRSAAFSAACGKFGGMFAALQGGAASWLRECIVSQKVIDFEDLGMEAVRLYEVRGLPAQMVVDSRGEDYYRQLTETLLNNPEVRA